MLSACGNGGPEMLGKEPAWRAVGSLLMPLAPYTLAEGATEEAIEVGYFKVGGGKLVGGGPRPGIRLPPPGEVSFEVPKDLAAGARLLIEMGFELRTHQRSRAGVAPSTPADAQVITSPASGGPSKRQRKQAPPAG